MYNDTNYPFNQDPYQNQNDVTGQTQQANSYESAQDINVTNHTTAPQYSDPTPVQTYSASYVSEQPVVSYNSQAEPDTVYNGTQYIPQPDSSTYQAPAATPPQPRERKKKEKKFITRKAAAVLCAFCIVASCAASFGGVMLANSLDNGQNSGTTTNQAGQLVQTSSSSGSKNVLSVADITAKAENSVVEITTEIVSNNGFWMQPTTGQAAGSGVILTSDGYIVTNNHVIEDAQTIQVRLKNGDTYTAQLIGTDPTTDVAIIKIDATGLTPATLGDSDSLQVGELAVAIGNPLGQLGGTVTDGIISALDREITLDGETMNLLQTNAAINPGNSGGGLFDSEGNLIGIVVAKSSGTDVEGLGFAIPINDVKDVIDDLINKGYVTGRVQLGVSLVDITTEQQMMMYGVDRTGTYIAQIENNSVAAKGGAQVGDCVLTFNGQEVTDASTLKELLGECNPGDVVEMQVLRNGQTVTLTLTLEEYVPEVEGAQALSGQA